jgi:hypothetical protein
LFKSSARSRADINPQGPVPVIPLPTTNPVSLEFSVMSRLRGFPTGTVRISDLARLDPKIAELFPEHAPKPLTPYVPFDAQAQLSTLQQAALLSMHTDWHVTRAIIRKLLADSQELYSLSDFAALRELELCERPQGYRLHKLTWQGNIAAADLLKALCCKFGVHVRLQGGAHNHLNSVKCCCGWSVMVERNIYAGSAGDVSFARHIRTMKAAAEALQKMESA